MPVIDLTNEPVPCPANGCIVEFAFDEGEIYEHLLKEHTHEEAAQAACNGLVFSDVIQERTANLVIRRFLEWVRHQNTVNEPIDGESPVFIPTGQPNEPSNDEINDLIDSFVELDAAFGN